MSRWAKTLLSICGESKDRELYLLEGDESLSWYGVSLGEICHEIKPSMNDSEVFKLVKGKTQKDVPKGEYIAYVSPVNFQVDIYESDRKRFINSSNSSRPFSITRDAFRIGFFPDKENAVDFFIKVRQRLKEEGITLHLFY